MSCPVRKTVINPLNIIDVRFLVSYYCIWHFRDYAKTSQLNHLLAGPATEMPREAPREVYLDEEMYRGLAQAEGEGGGIEVQQSML